MDRLKRRLEPGNSRLQYAAPPNYLPSYRTVNRTIEELEAARDRVSTQIGRHAFQQGHGDRYFAGAGEFELSGIARRVIANTANARVDLPRGRTGYYEARSGTVVIVEPDITGGTMIRRSDGLQYLQRLKRR